MLLQDTPVLIFDDSLSAVDAETDAAIRDALHSRRHGTMFLISHRIATIRKSDLILVLDKGRVVQMGTHDTLAAQEGLYRRVCAIQNELPQAGVPERRRGVMAQNDFENKRDSAAPEDRPAAVETPDRLCHAPPAHGGLRDARAAGGGGDRPCLSAVLPLAIDHFIEGGTTEGLWLYGLVYAALVVVQSLGVFLFVRGAGRLEMDMSYDIRQERLQSSSSFRSAFTTPPPLAG